MSSDNSVPADEAFEQAIRSSSDDRWSERVEAVRVLGTYLQKPEAFDRLAVMLDDSDTAVVEAAVETLAKAGGIGGMKAILKALSAADAQVGEHIRDRLVSLWLNGSPISERIREILTENLSAEVRDGAIEMIKTFHLDQFDTGNGLPTLRSSLDKLAPAGRTPVSLPHRRRDRHRAARTALGWDDTARQREALLLIDALEEETEGNQRRLLLRKDNHTGTPELLNDVFKLLADSDA